MADGEGTLSPYDRVFLSKVDHVLRFAIAEPAADGGWVASLHGGPSATGVEGREAVLALACRLMNEEEHEVEVQRFVLTDLELRAKNPD